MRSLPLSVAGALAITLSAGAASADDAPDAVRAATLFAEGRQLMAAQDYAAACPKLAESQALDPAADTALDLGICYQKASEQAFKVARELAPSSEHGSAAALVPTRILLPAAEEPTPGRTQRIVGLSLGGAGAAGLVVGVITALVAKSAYDNVAHMCINNVCPPYAVQQVNSEVSMARASTISFIAGAAVLGTGAVVFFTAPRSTTSAGATVGLGPASEGAGLSLGGRF
jgi:hypothetical protein